MSRPRERREARSASKKATKAKGRACDSRDNIQAMRELVRHTRKLVTLELRKAEQACKSASEAAAETSRRAAALAPDPKRSASSSRSAGRRAELGTFAVRDAVARVMDVSGAPEVVAELAVKTARRKLPTAQRDRWERLAEAVGEGELAEAWQRWERQQGRKLDRLAWTGGRGEQVEQVVIIEEDDGDDFADPPF